jgi:hypothetical protein
MTSKIYQPAIAILTYRSLWKRVTVLGQSQYPRHPDRDNFEYQVYRVMSECEYLISYSWKDKIAGLIRKGKRGNIDTE